MMTLIILLYKVVLHLPSPSFIRIISPPIIKRKRCWYGSYLWLRFPSSLHTINIYEVDESGYVALDDAITLLNNLVVVAAVSSIFWFFIEFVLVRIGK